MVALRVEPSRKTLGRRNIQYARERRSEVQPPPPVKGARWIPLSAGKFALVDSDMFEELNRVVWSYTASSGNREYAIRMTPDGRMLQLHNQIMSLEPGVQVDHINRDGLDCRRKNLRRATHAQNNQNKLSRGGTSKYKGVSWNGFKSWRARIAVEKTHVHLGAFKTEEEAARAYDEAARRYHGEFARLNFPRPGEQSALEER